MLSTSDVHLPAPSNTASESDSTPPATPRVARTKKQKKTVLVFVKKRRDSKTTRALLHIANKLRKKNQALTVDTSQILSTTKVLTANQRIDLMMANLNNLKHEYEQHQQQKYAYSNGTEFDPSFTQITIKSN